MILARTLKGKGVSFLEGAPNWHGKALKKGEELDRAITRARSAARARGRRRRRSRSRRPPDGAAPETRRRRSRRRAYKLGDQVATREAYGTALARLGTADSRVVALDADVKNSTFSDKFEAAHPDRFYQCFIAEQAMIGAAMGLAARGAIPFPSTFAAFLTRAADFIRMLAISDLNVKMAGSHAGVSIGEDGPSQMALEDLVDDDGAAEHHGAVSVATRSAPSTWSATRRASPGPVYIRTIAPEDAGDLRQRRDVPDRRAARSCARAATTSRRSSAPASRCSRRSRRTTS